MKTRLLALTASASLAVPAAADVYTIDFFPKLPQTNAIQQLVFIGPSEGRITNARLVIEFTTLSGFDAADLTILLVANVDPLDPDAGFWFLTGSDLGWSGQGTFVADLTTDDLNGTIVPGIWQFDLGSVLEPPAYSGQFSADTRFEITIEGGACYPDCNQDEVLTVADFGCSRLPSCSASPTRTATRTATGPSPTSAASRPASCWVVLDQSTSAKARRLFIKNA